ncbi:MAG: TerB family tellurite resistance protein [Myxococcales bacterium]|nr:TerB family tellurite resistance protein [Myxococcales bacterium]HRC54528.1 hypothetical protein [Kofleriaceae bacterium]
MERVVKEIFRGSLRANDPRRFVIEAMVGAMLADGVSDQRELEIITTRISRHPLFEGLSAEAAKTLVELSADSIRFAGGSMARASTVGKSLPARVHRISAFAMAAEVCASDTQFVDSERQYLETLRLALRIGPLEAEYAYSALATGELNRFLEDRVLRIHSLTPLVCDLFALRAAAKAMANDDQRFAVSDFCAAIPDFLPQREQLDSELYAAFKRAALVDDIPRALRALAEALPDPIDRYWLVVYALAAEPPAAITSWRIIPFIGLLQSAFQIVDADLELAVSDALSFPASTPRPG